MVLVPWGVTTEAAEYVVRHVEELRTLLPRLASGDVLRLAPGTYPGGHSVREVDCLTVEALDPSQLPVFQGGNVGWHFSRCSKLTVRHLHLRGQAQAGLNIDDGGPEHPPPEGILIEEVRVSDVGPRGNYDGIKGSGLKGVTIRRCAIEGWGGQGIDLVGCHQVLITSCELKGKEGFTATAGVQAKGGCSDVVIEHCRFLNAGQRALNLGAQPAPRFSARRMRNMKLRA